VVEPLALLLKGFHLFLGVFTCLEGFLSDILACVLWECDKKHLGACEDHTWCRVWLVLLSNILLVSVFGEF